MDATPNREAALSDRTVTAQQRLCWGDDECQVVGDQTNRRGEMCKRHSARRGRTLGQVNVVRRERMQLTLRALEVSAPIEGNDDAPPGTRLTAQLGLRLGQTARRKAGFGCVERGASPAKGKCEVKGAELGKAGGNLVHIDQGPGLAFILKTLCRPSKCNPVVVRRETDDARSRDGGIVQRSNALGPVRLVRRPDEHAFEGTDGTLGERREGTDRLDLVPEELNPNGRVRRRGEAVNDAPPRRDVAALLDLGDALVPHAEQVLSKVVAQHRFARAERQRLDSRLRSQSAFCQGGDAGDHETSGMSQGGQGARPQSDEVRCCADTRTGSGTDGRPECDRAPTKEGTEGSREVASLLICRDHRKDGLVNLARERRQEPRESWTRHDDLPGGASE